MRVEISAVGKGRKNSVSEEFFFFYGPGCHQESLPEMVAYEECEDLFHLLSIVSSNRALKANVV